jgi:hypothetical protein
LLSFGEERAKRASSSKGESVYSSWIHIWPPRQSQKRPRAGLSITLTKITQPSWVWGTAKPISGAKQFRSGATMLSFMWYTNNKRISLTAYSLTFFHGDSWMECNLSYLAEGRGQLSCNVICNCKRKISNKPRYFRLSVSQNEKTA